MLKQLWPHFGQVLGKFGLLHILPSGHTGFNPLPLHRGRSRFLPYITFPRHMLHASLQFILITIAFSLMTVSSVIIMIKIW